MKEGEQREAIRRILEHEDRYAREAYAFVQEGVTFAAHAIQAREHEEVGRRHISGQELLEAMRELALRQYGPLAYDVLTQWGILTCEDIGTVVFLLVNNGLLGASEEDSIEDFRGGYDFREAFLQPYAAPDGEDGPPPDPIY